MLFLTCTNRAMMECAFYNIRSVERYLTKYPKYHFAVEAIPEGYDRPASWFKVQALLKHLPDHDYVLWLDADAMVVGKEDIGAMIKDATLNIARDRFGLNNGVAAWKNCAESVWALETMNRSFDRWKEGEWFEQHQLMELEPQLSIHWQEKRVFNAYYGEDVCDETMIIHWPGKLPHDRLPLMHEVLENKCRLC
jgi:hypothetical protein